MSLAPSKVLPEQKTKLSLGREIKFQNQGIEKGVSDLFKGDSSIQIPETHKNSLDL